MKCPHCQVKLDYGDFVKIAKYYARRGGSVKSEAKAKAVRENGKKGGRPIKRCKGCGNPSLKVIKKMERFWYYKCSDCQFEQRDRKF